jgi:NAD(P)-dependent dehydrogenase (short-subunit alcohol dehydrogenase family)
LEARRNARAPRRDRKPEVLVGTVFCLASSDADLITGQTVNDADLITGQTVNVDGGKFMP